MKRLRTIRGAFVILSVVIFFFCMTSPTSAHSKVKDVCGDEGVCECRTGENETYVVDCSNRKLNQVPKNIPSKTTSLYLDCNRITKPDKSVFRSLSRLQFLNMSFNEINDIDADTFGYLVNLITLDLSDNKIYQLHDDTLKNLSRLQNLFLSQNKFQKFPSAAVSQQPSLQVLLFKRNQITYLPSPLFKPNNKTYQLRVLFISDNRLEYLPEDVFYGLPNLEVVSLHYNKIRAMGVNCFAGMGIGNVYLYGNNFTNLTNSSFNNEKIKEIHIYGSKIIQIDNIVVAGLSENAKFYVDCEKIEEIRQPKVELTCVQRQFVPDMRLPFAMRTIVENAGFRCGDETCSPCPRGQFGRHGKCITCPIGGFYQDKIGAWTKNKTELFCKKCPTGRWVRQGEGTAEVECTDCPDGTNRAIVAGYRGCFCSEIYGRTDRLDECIVCLEEGIICNGKDYKHLKPGYYWNWDIPKANITMYQKLVDNLNTENRHYDPKFNSYDGDFPRAFKCPHYHICSNSTNFVENLCPKGHTGWFCSKCDKRYYLVLTHCIPCPSTEWLGLEVALICCSFVILYAIAVRLYKMDRFRNRHGRHFVDQVVSRGKIALGFYQVLGEFFTSVHDVYWAQTLQFIGDVVSIVELNIFRLVIRPKCFDEKWELNPKSEFMIGMIFPCVLISLSFIIVWLFKLRNIIKSRYAGVSEANIALVKSVKSKLLTAVVVLLVISYPPISTSVFQLYPGSCEKYCLDRHNTTCRILLRSDYGLKCENMEIYHIFAYIGTIIYVFGFPTILYVLMRKNTRHNLARQPRGYLSEINNQTDDDAQHLVEGYSRTRRNPAWIEFLCENYKPQFWYWEIVELTRKVSQTALISVIGWESKITVLATSSISILFLTLHAGYMPMKSTFEQRLQMFSLSAILANVLVAAVDVPDKYGDELTITLVTINFMVIIIIIAEAIVGFFMLLKHAAVHRIVFNYVVSCAYSILNFLRTRIRRTSRGHDLTCADADCTNSNNEQS